MTTSLKIRRAQGAVVLEESDIQLAYDALGKIAWRRDPPTQTLRLGVPVEDRP